nr:fused MFS/spermidine synthase [Salsipaludibacter albus]
MSARSLYSGTTAHGAQLLEPELSTRPVGYYDPEGPVGDWLPLVGRDRSIGVIGLGAGTVATYVREGQDLRYHEIDALVEEIAREDFTFLEQARGDVEVVIGDGRLTLQDVPDGGYDLLMIDAFTSDSIPVHLLTTEAFEVYDRVIDEDGVLLVHISNRYLDLEPVVAAGADAIGMTAWTRRAPGVGPVKKATIWMAMTRRGELPDGLPNADQWVEPGSARVSWTDDFSNLVEVWN